MTKILIMAAHFYPYKGGLENFVLELSKGLIRKGIKVDVLTYNVNNNKELEKYEGINIIRLPCTSILGKTYTLPKFNKEYKVQIKKVLSENYAAIITNTRFFTTSYLGYKYSKKLKKNNSKTKFIHVEHGNVHVIHSNPFVTILAYIYDQTVGRIIFKNADLAIGISQRCANFAKKLGAKKTVVIHNSINTNQFKPISKTQQIKLKKKLNIKPTNIVIINGIGRLIYAKGLHNTFEALKDSKNTTIITIGQGPYKEKLENLANKYSFQSIFTGNLNKKEIIEYLSIADVFINPSFSEGLPTCVLEAGIMSVPVIATNVGGTIEIIPTKKEGILIRPDSVIDIKKAIKNIKPSKTLKKHIQNNFDWEKTINKFKEIIK